MKIVINIEKNPIESKFNMLKKVKEKARIIRESILRKKKINIKIVL